MRRDLVHPLPKRRQPRRLAALVLLVHVLVGDDPPQRADAAVVEEALHLEFFLEYINLSNFWGENVVDFSPGKGG